ncbi:MAG: sigma-70 family RNA polymerase sigma factor [Verrucomicrobiales bacterium]
MPSVNQRPNPDFSELVARHQSRLYGYVLSLVFDPDLAKDVLQETNLVLCKKADRFEPGTNFLAWAFRVAYFEVMRQRRRTGRDRLVFDEDLMERVAQEAEGSDERFTARRRALAHCLRKLGDRQRALILKRYYEGEAVQNIAVQRGESANAVSQALFRARQNLLACVSLAVPISRR